MFFFCFKNKCMHIAYCILNSNTYFFWWRYQQKNKSKTIDCEMCFMGFNFTVSNADKYVSFENLHVNRSGDSKRWKLLRPYHKISTRCSTLFKTYQNVHWNFFSVFLLVLFYFVSSVSIKIGLRRLFRPSIVVNSINLRIWLGHHFALLWWTKKESFNFLIFIRFVCDFSFSHV